jgi:hypothetical protein
MARVKIMMRVLGKESISVSRVVVVIMSRLILTECFGVSRVKMLG